jgi:ABC transporter substrate binding protein
MQFDQLRRREFVTLLCGAAAWPLAARAQQAGKLPTIGFLGSSSASGWSPWTAAFVQRLNELGWVEGRTVAIEYRWADGRSERFADIAAEFVRLKVDVIVTSGLAVHAAKQVTSVVPIVFAVASDPIGTGMIASLARPGGNVTGLSQQSRELAGKRLELLREMVPALHRLAAMGNVGSPSFALEIGDVQAAVRALGLDVATFEIRRNRAGLSGDQGPRRCALCHWQRPAHRDQAGVHQHTCGRSALADRAQHTGIRRSRRSAVLWSKLRAPVLARRQLCRQDSTRRETGGPSGRAADQVRAGRQSDDRQGARHRSPAVASRPRRRGD